MARTQTPDDLTTAIRLRTEGCERGSAPIDVQHKRLTDPTWAAPEGQAPAIPNDFADFQFMIVAMWRLRRVVEQLVLKVPTTFFSLETDLAEFDDAMPVLKRLRDVGEHVEECNLDVGSGSGGKSEVDPVYRQQLQTFGFGQHSMNRLGECFVYDDAWAAALRLSLAFEHAVRTWGLAPEASIRVGDRVFDAGDSRSSDVKTSDVDDA